MDMISLLEEVLDMKAIINFMPMQPGDPAETCAEIKYSEDKIEYSPQTSIKKGIPKLINWYRSYYK